MKPSLSEWIDKFLNYYKRNVLTKKELTLKLTDLANHPDFFSHLHKFPEETLADLKEKCKTPYSHPEDISLDMGGTYMPGTDIEAFRRKKERLLYWGIRRLHEHFYPDQPLPEFEVLKYIGKVDDVRVINGTVAIRGKLSYPRVMDFPLHIRRPDGKEIITSVTIRESFDENWERTPRSVELRPVLFLDKQVQGASDAPVGSEVWVDRTSIKELPPPPTPEELW